jgi:Reverse transcriptase (RNA-dependent DNA polymerase)
MGVWRMVKRNEVLKDKRCIKSRWVFDIKRNVVFRARLVVCGYSKVPGEDFNEVYSPVGNEPVIWTLSILCMILKLV